METNRDEYNENGGVQIEQSSRDVVSEHEEVNLASFGVSTDCKPPAWKNIETEYT